MRQKLQRHSSSQPRVLGLVHHSHAAATQLLHNFVMGYRLTNHRASTLRAVILGAPSLPSQLHVPHVSKLFRNVPFLTSIEMSPFFVLYLFLLLSTLARKLLLQDSPGTTILVSVGLRDPCFSTRTPSLYLGDMRPAARRHNIRVARYARTTASCDPND